jgi:hypothetical protein
VAVVVDVTSTLTIINKLHVAAPFFISRQLYSYSENSQNFTEPEGSLPCSQELSTYPYPQPDQSRPYHLILSLKIHFVLSAHLHLGLPNGFFPSGFATDILYEFLFSPFELHASPISFSFTWSFYLYLTKSTNYGVSLTLMRNIDNYTNHISCISPSARRCKRKWNCPNKLQLGKSTWINNATLGLQFFPYHTHVFILRGITMISV